MKVHKGRRDRLGRTDSRSSLKYRLSYSKFGPSGILIIKCTAYMLQDRTLTAEVTVLENDVRSTRRRRNRRKRRNVATPLLTSSALGERNMVNIRKKLEYVTKFR